MIQYESLSTITLTSNNAKLRTIHLPEIVHLDDPAFSVMNDFNINPPRTIVSNESMDNTLNEMKLRGVHMLLVSNDDENIIGIITTEDLLGEKPIKLLQENRIERVNITVKMLMTPLDKIIAIDTDTVQTARVGNIVKTLKDHAQHYALVVDCNNDLKHPAIRGLFNTSQISKQLHMDVAHSTNCSDSVSELNKSHEK